MAATNLFLPFLHFNKPMLILAETADPHIDFLHFQTVGFAVVREHIDNVTDCVSPHAAEHDGCRPHMTCALEVMTISSSIITIDWVFGIFCPSRE